MVREVVQRIDAEVAAALRIGGAQCAAA
jgi:hypothetical protein